MRKIPVVGSLLNWWSPNQANVTGRAFDLASSSVQTVKKVRRRAACGDACHLEFAVCACVLL